MKEEPFMISAKIEQKSFLGNPDKVLGNIFAYIEEVKSSFESEVLKGLGFGLIFYHLHADGGDVVVLTGNQIVKELVSFKCRPPAILSEKSEQWTKSFNILRDWKYVEPSSIAYGWKDKHSFSFSHSMAIPTMAADGSALHPSKVVECHIFKSINPRILPFVLIDGVLAPPRGNALCVVEAAPEEELLYSRLKSKVEEEQNVKFYFVKTLFKSKRPAILLKAFKYLGQMRYQDELFKTALDVCLANSANSSNKLLDAMEKAIFSRNLPALRSLVASTEGSTKGRVYQYLNDGEASRRRIAARFYFLAESHPDTEIIVKLIGDPDPTIRQLVAERLGDLIQSESIRPVLFKLLSDSSAEVRLKTIKSLAAAPDEEIYAKLITVADDPDAGVKAAAVAAFAHEAASPWVNQVIEILQNGRGEVLRAAAKALRYSANEKHLPLIKSIYQRLKADKEVNGALVELEWTILALEGNISELEKMEESYGAKFSRIWISPVIRRAREIEQNRQGRLSTLNRI